MNMLNLPKKVYFKNGSMAVALRELTEVYNLKRALIVSDPNLYATDIVLSIDKQLRKQGLSTAEFFSIDAVPTFANIHSALPKMLEFHPDAIVGVGGGAVMSAAKAMWMLYENPELDLAKASKDPDCIHVGEKAHLALVATSFGSGAQNSPFAVLKNDAGKLCVFNSFQLLPTISVSDSRYTQSLSAEQVKACGLALLSQSIRAFAAPGCNEYTQGLLREAVRSVLNNLKDAENGCPVAREKLHSASSIAGAAFGNVMDTVDVTAALYPTDAEKSAKDDRIEILAHDLGLSGSKALCDACAALR